MTLEENMAEFNLMAYSYPAIKHVSSRRISEGLVLTTARERFPGRLISHLPALASETERFSESRTRMQRFSFCQSISLE